MKKEIEKRNVKVWDQVLSRDQKRLIPKSNLASRTMTLMPIGFGSITKARWCADHFINRSFGRENLSALKELQKTFGQKYNSISFHSYYLKDRETIIKETN